MMLLLLTCLKLSAAMCCVVAGPSAPSRRFVVRGGDQVADGVVRHGGDDACVQAEAVGQVRGNIEFAAAHVDLARRRFTEGDDPGIQTVDQCPQRHQIQRTLGTNLQSVAHGLVLLLLAA